MSPTRSNAPLSPGLPSVLQDPQLQGLAADILRLTQRATRFEPLDPDAVDAFGALVLRDQDGARVDLAPLHQSWSRFVLPCWLAGLYAGILAPWRHGKTSLCTIRLALWEIGRNLETRIRIICADDDEAMLRVAAVRRYLETPEYQWVFPHVRPAVGTAVAGMVTSGRHAADWTKHRIFVARRSPGPDPTLEASGVFTAMAGGGTDLLILDDTVTYQNSLLRPALRARVYEAFSAVWLRRVEPTTRVVLVGTTWHGDDAYHLLRRQGSGRWAWLIQGISEEFDAIDTRLEIDRQNPWACAVARWFIEQMHGRKGITLPQALIDWARAA